MKLLKVYPITQDGRYPLFHETHSSKLKEGDFYDVGYIYELIATDSFFRNLFYSFLVVLDSFSFCILKVIVGFSDYPGNIAGYCFKAQVGLVCFTH